MDIQRALALIEDLSATYDKIKLRKMPPQYIVYQHIKTLEEDRIHFLAHNVLSEDSSSWAWDVISLMHELDHADGFLFFAIIEFHDTKKDALLITIHDKDSGSLKTYFRHLDTLELEEAKEHFFFDRCFELYH